MEREIIKRIMGSLRPNEGVEEYPKFSDKRYSAFKISKENFHKIENVNSDNKVAFVDGGNIEIMGSADFSLHFVRVYYTVYQRNKRIKSDRKEFYVLASAFDKDGEIHYMAEVFPDNEVDIDKEAVLFNSFDATLKEGTHRVKISKIGEIVRRFAELKIASEILDLLGENDILVRDGSLQSSVTNEKRFFDEIYKKAIKKGVLITGLSKTSTLLTDKGNSLSSAIRRQAPEGEWYYYPVVEINSSDHEAEMYFIKLHKNSRYIFRFEVHKGQKHDVNKILSVIAGNSKDAEFIGYPYGLVEADKFARVNEKERDHLKMKFMVMAGKEWKRISDDEKTVDAHDMIM